MCSITCFMMISETPVYLQVEKRYIPSTTQMISTFEVSSVEFDNKRLTSALKKRHRYHFGGQRFKQRFTGILCLPPQQLKNLCIQSLTGDCVTLGCSTAMVSLDPFSAQLKRKSQSQSQRESGPRPPFFSFFAVIFLVFSLSLFLFVVRTTRNLFY